MVGSEQQMRGLRNDVINMSRAWDIKNLSFRQDLNL